MTCLKSTLFIPGKLMPVQMPFQKPGEKPRSGNKLNFKIVLPAKVCILNLYQGSEVRQFQIKLYNILYVNALNNEIKRII